MHKEKEKISGFRDILLERRVTSDIMWASRSWNPVLAYVQPHKSSATEIKYKVYSSYRLKQVIDEVLTEILRLFLLVQETFYTVFQISQEESVAREELYRKVKFILDEMGYNREIPVLRWLGLFTSKILKKLCSAIYVNENELLKVGRY